MTTTNLSDPIKTPTVIRKKNINNYYFALRITPKKEQTMERKHINILKIKQLIKFYSSLEIILHGIL